MIIILFYELTNFLYVSINEQAIVIKALYECEIDVVLKFGYLSFIIKEYNISNELQELPNFIRYVIMKIIQLVF